MTINGLRETTDNQYFSFVPKLWAVLLSELSFFEIKFWPEMVS